MNTVLVNTAAGVINAALARCQTAAGVAVALDSAQLLMTPETAAELEAFRSLELADIDGRVSASCPEPGHATWLRAKDDGRSCPWCRVEELEAQRDRRRARLVALQNDALAMRGSLSPNGEDRKVPFELGETLTPAVDWLIGRVAELEGRQADIDLLTVQNAALEKRLAEREAAPTAVYRAEHPDSGITLGHYGAEAAARAHCEAEERRSWLAGTTLAFDWIEDDEDRVAELVVRAGQNEESVTGYLVTALELDSAYDEEADQ